MMASPLMPSDRYQFSKELTILTLSSTQHHISKNFWHPLQLGANEALYFIRVRGRKYVWAHEEKSTIIPIHHQSYYLFM